MKIWKFSLSFTTPRAVLVMPQGAKILALKKQAGIPMLWAWVDNTTLTEKRIIDFYGTGVLLPDNSGVYIGTLADVGGNVWHYFDATETAK